MVGAVTTELSETITTFAVICAARPFPETAQRVKKTFKGEIVGEEYTDWPGQLDFSAELTKVRSVKRDAVWMFYPGKAGAQFMQQYAQAGLREGIPTYSVFTMAALGSSGLEARVSFRAMPCKSRRASDRTRSAMSHRL
jgi:hypothetical protein